MQLSKRSNFRSRYHFGNSSTHLTPSMKRKFHIQVIIEFLLGFSFTHDLQQGRVGTAGNINGFNQALVWIPSSFPRTWRDQEVCFRSWLHQRLLTILTQLMRLYIPEIWDLVFCGCQAWRLLGLLYCIWYILFLIRQMELIGNIACGYPSDWNEETFIYLMWLLRHTKFNNHVNLSQK